MSFGLLMRDNTPVDFPFRRGAAPQAAVRLGLMPSGPHRMTSFAGRRFRGYGIPPMQAQRVPQYGWVDSTGGGDDPAPLPGTSTDSESTGWASTATGLINLATGIVNAVAGSINPSSGAAGSRCPPGYYLANGRCYPPQQSSGGNMSMLALGALGLGAAFLLLRKK